MTHHSRALTTAHIALLASTALTVAACGTTPDDTSGAASASTTATSAPSSSGTFAPTSAISTSESTPLEHAATEDIRAATAPTDGGPGAPYTLDDTRMQTPGASELVIEDIRAGSHDGFDRLVVELSGAGTPNVLAGYTTDPRQQASGYPLVPAGSAYFDLIIQGVPWTMGLSEADLAKADPAGVAAGGITEIANGGVFEADAQYVVGLNTRRPYHLYLLENPTRVVVDFQK